MKTLILTILLIIAIVLTFKVLGWITRIWLKVFAFGALAVIGLIVFGAMLLL